MRDWYARQRAARPATVLPFPARRPEPAAPARGLPGPGGATGEGEAPADAAVTRDPDAELLALGAEMGLLGEVLRAWPDDAAVECADARLAAIELEIAPWCPAPVPGSPSSCASPASSGPPATLIVPDGDGPLPDGHDRARLLWRLVDEAEALGRGAAGRGPWLRLGARLAWPCPTLRAG
jgi:hypothetical protein